jgi:nitroimidazol reductase NimA-like FMN-containing flavoprotein (pyridoxamine 5'-phosphate oxidase superfamily)
MDADLLRTMVHDVVDGNRYLVLGTVEPDGLPRLSPVYFTHDDYHTFFWVSAPGAHHSRNVERQPSVSAVIFDSTTLPGAGEAVYLSAQAQQVPEEELPGECTRAFRNIGDRGAEPFTPAELSGDEPLRLYRAVATRYEVHIRGGHPTLGTGIDKRLPVNL